MAGIRPEDFQNNVVAELKRIVAEQRAQELADAAIMAFVFQ
jgi:hypothetical protein